MSKPYHIVLADDDDDDQFIMKEALQEFGDIQVTSVYDGLQLLDCLNKKGLFKEHPLNPDLILLDINMPLMNGLEVLDKIKKNAKFKSIPVYMISTLRTIERVDKSLALGAKNLYSKPNYLAGYKPIFQEIFDNTMLAESSIAC